ncbi:MAG: hypothetical protein JWM98_1506 [Thermoleophilia bacterium]|nr:hypothetical protein [Thermoleophilia bacterium]
MSLTEVAPWIAAAVGLVAAAAVGWWAWQAWCDYRRVQRTREAALALLDVHRDRLDAAMALAGERSGTIADDGEALAASIAELRGDVDGLRWLLERVPEARATLRREVLDTLLPTDA